MSVKRLNRSGPISFTQLASGSPYSSVNQLLENVDLVVPTQNISLSASLARLKAFTGDPNDNVKSDAGVGVGLVSYDTTKDAKMSEFYGANYLSASIKASPSSGLGVWYAQFYPDSVVYNSNYLTKETSSRAYRYSVYSKPTDLSTGLVKQSSYVRANDSEEYISNLVNTRIYKVVLKDVASNAFTSSFFTGSCNASSTVGSSLACSSNNTANITAARDSIINVIGVSSLDGNRKSDLITIVNKIPGFVANPDIFPLTGYNRIYTANSWPAGGTRTFTFEGFIANLVAGGRYYAGLVTCTGGTGGITYEYGIDEVVTTAGQASIKTFALAPSSTGAGCGASLPTNAVNNVAVTQNCFFPAQPSSTLPDISTIRFTGSVIIANPAGNVGNMTVTLNSDWFNTANGKVIAGTKLDPEFSPASFGPLAPGANKKVSFAFGRSFWSDPNQSSSFSAKGTYKADFNTGTTPLTGYITATMNKNVCVTTGDAGGGCPAAWQLMETQEHGFIPASEIKVGMHLRDSEDGVWNLVTVAYLETAPIWRTVIDGDTFDVDESHLWYIGNGVWRSVKTLVAGDMVENSNGDKLIIDSNSLYMQDGEYMHLNCHNHRFLMGGKAIGHNNSNASNHVVYKY